MNHEAILIGREEFDRRVAKVRAEMTAAGLDSALVSDNANKFYLTGRIFNGSVYLAPGGEVALFVRRPSGLSGAGVYHIHKPENILDILRSEGISEPRNLGLELSEEPYAVIVRLAKALGVETFGNVDPALMRARMVKTDEEIRLIEECGVRHERVYRMVPRVYREGMTDVELMVEVERIARLEGSIGIMRTAGHELEINMGSVLTGDNADHPSPYDFAMGGAGTSPALPVGADGTLIRPHKPVMLDMNGCFNGYMTDMTRVYAVGEIPDEGYRAHQVSIDICLRLAEMGRPGTACADMYNEALRIATEAGLEKNFMGHASQSGFVGHGIGIAVNELPVLQPRSREVLSKGMVIAIEPKFVLEGIGAVGIENTYVVTDEGLRCLTHVPEDVISLPE